MSGKSRPLSLVVSSVIPLLFAIFLSSCSIWDSTTAYFNTYYNASKQYSEAEEEVWTAPEVIKQGRYNYLAQFNIQPNTKTKFNSVIEKCSKLIQYHAESNLVDDAVMMIGMSYYFQGDWTQSDRKFRELVTTYPNSSYAPRARMFSAACAYRLNLLDSAAVLAGQVIQEAREDGNDALLGHASMILGMVELNRGNGPAAAGQITIAAKYGENATLRTSRYLTLGDLYAKLKEYEKAQEAYESAANASDNYLGEYRGTIGAAKMRCAQKDYDGAMNVLQRLRNNSNNREFFGEIELEIGNTIRDEGDINSAVRQYHYVDTAYARTEYAAGACYQMGLLYENVAMNYDSARVVYIRGKNHSGVALTMSEMIRRIDYLTRYDLYVREIGKLDSVKAAAIAAQSRWAAEDSLRREATSARTDSAAAGKDSTAAGKDSTAAGKDSTAARKDSTPARKDSTAAPVPRGPVLSIDSLENRQAVMMTELATLFYATMGRSDSAAKWYRNVIAKYPDNAAIPRAMFTLAQIVREDSTSPPGAADSLYTQIIARFPRSEYANEARRLLGIPLERIAKDDAELAYTKAEDLFIGDKPTEAIQAFETVAETFPKSPFAPRAQYAIGWTYENILIQPDSAITHYQAIVSGYPTSPFVALVQPKLTEVQQQRAREAKAAADSAKATQAPPVAPVPVAAKPAETVQQKPAADDRQSSGAREPGAGRRSRKQQPSQPGQVVD